MASAIKKTTNLTGLTVAKNSRQRLLYLYNRILGVLQKFPESSAYRKSTEELVRHRSIIVENNESVAEIEKKIGCGQIEELLIQADKEKDLAKKMLTWKSWETLKTPAPKNQWSWPAV